MIASAVLAEMDRQGIRYEAVGNGLRVQGVQAPSPDLREAIAEHKSVLIRIATFRQQIKEWREAGHVGSPFLAFYDAIEIGETDACLSCGDPCVPGTLVPRCGPCISAAEIAIKAEAV